MPYLLIHHNVEDYDKFRSVFDFDADRRRRSGSRGGRLLRSNAAANDLWALFEWDDADRARAFAAAYETHEAFEWVGAYGEVTAYVLEEVDEVEA
jgi:hypothetical protein